MIMAINRLHAHGHDNFSLESLIVAACGLGARSCLTNHAECGTDIIPAVSNQLCVETDLPSKQPSM